MGDPSRHVEFSKFLRRNFGSRCETVLCVADGKGELAAELTKWARSVRVIEASPRQTIKRKRVTYQKGWFTRSSQVVEDLVVGMHPDEATTEIVRAAMMHGKRWAVVPCCLKGLDAHGVSNYRAWVEKIMKIGGERCRATTLPIGGKNVVIWSA